MKRIILAIIFIAGILLAYRAGKMHVITSAEIWLNEWVEVDSGNWEVNLTVDDNTYIHTLWVY